MRTLPEKREGGGLMWQAFIVVLREGFESFLIVAIILAYLRKIRRPQLLPSVYWGIGASVLVSGVLGYLLLQGTDEALWEGVFGVVAAVLVGWLVIHMWRTAPRLKQDMEDHLHEATRDKPAKTALAGVFLFTVLMISREGMETALLLIQIHEPRLVAGILLGLAAAIAMSLLWVRVGHLINLKLFFQVTAVYLLLFIAQILIYSFHEFTEVGIFPYSEQLHLATEPFSPSGLYGKWFSAAAIGGCALWLLGAWIQSRLKRSSISRLGSCLAFIFVVSAGNLEAQEPKPDPKRKDAEEVVVTAEKYDKSGPFLPEVKGTRIYSGKKTSAVHLEQSPAVANNNYRQALAKTPGLLLSEETTPLVSLGYRGLNPHRGQFTQIMKDGIPIHADMFGYPEAYYTPILQTVEDIEFIRGGAALMYGPQPGGALNYVTKMPATDRKFGIRSENIFGSDNLFSTYETLTGTAGPLGYLGYFHERQGDGFREKNSDFEVLNGGLKLTLNQTGDSRWTGTYEEYHEEHGEPGGLSLTASPSYHDNRERTTREFDRFRLERYYGTLAYEKEFSEDTQLDFKTYGGHYRRTSKRQRGGGFGTPPAGANAQTNEIEEQDFYNLGFEPRVRRHYELLGERHTATFGIHTFMSHSPREDQRGTTAAADTGNLRKRSLRDSWYLSVFLENLFRWKKLAVTPGVRLEHFWQHLDEKTNLDKTAVPLADKKEFDFVPLFGLGISCEIVKAVEAYANISQSYRPKIYTEAVPTGTNQVVPNDLTEGSAWQYDFGLRGNPYPFVSWDIDYFLLDFKDQIGTVGNSVENVGDARHHGMEFAAEADMIGLYDHLSGTKHSEKFGSLAPFYTLTLLDAEFNEGPNSGRQPQYAPQYNMRFGLNYRWKERVKVSLLSTFVDDHFADDAGTLNRKIPSYKVWDLTAEFVILSGAKDLRDSSVSGLRMTGLPFDLSFFGGINNLFDENYYARIRGDGIDPAYGRNLYGGVKVNWG